MSLIILTHLSFERQIANNFHLQMSTTVVLTLIVMVKTLFLCVGT